jgi:hypothetical protein
MLFALCAFDGREGDDKFRSHIDLAFYLYLSALLFHDIFGDG